MPEIIVQVATACEVPKKQIKSLFERTACIAVSYSHRIFNSRAFPGLGSTRSSLNFKCLFIFCIVILFIIISVSLPGLLCCSTWYVPCV